MSLIPLQSLPFNHLDDYSFDLAIYELQNGPVHYDPDRLSSLSFDPLFTNHNPALTRSDTLDPDINFNLDNVACAYFIEDSFNQMLRNENYSDGDFSLFHLNIRSLQRNFNNLINLLSLLDINFTLIGVSGTWLNEPSHLLEIDGYNFIHKHRPNISGGEVGLYIYQTILNSNYVRT